jgi:hypothetical protein
LIMMTYLAFHEHDLLLSSYILNGLLVGLWVRSYYNLTIFDLDFI